MGENRGVIAVVAGLVVREGRIMICRRPEGKLWAGLWEFPGGKLEPGESLEQALERELREELGIDTRTGRIYAALRGPAGNDNVVLLFYHSRIVSGEPRALEGQQIAWVRPDELARYEFVPNDAQLLDMLAADAARFADSSAQGGEVTFITGGARSGKSTLAERMAHESGLPVLYIATARAFDDEMRERIRIHRSRRPAHWRTFEGVSGLAAAVEGFHGMILLDCVTLLITNRMMDSGADWDNPQPQDIQAAEAEVLGEVEALIAAVRADGSRLVLVSNEVGLGLVPAYPFGRAFRDIAGRVNQRLRTLSDRALFCVAGASIDISHR